LHHPFDTQINEEMNNAVLRRCPKNKVFAGSGGRQYRVASVAGQHTQGMYASDVECRCQHCKNPSGGDKKKSDEETMEPIKYNSNKRGNEAKKYMQHDSKQSNRKDKITNQIRLMVLVLRSEGNIRKQEGKEQMSAIIVAAMIIKGKAVHSVPSMYLAGKVPDHTGMCMINDDQLPTSVDIVPANTQENVTCAPSSVASLGLQDRANQANQLSVSN
jgi:hypothetical protein